MYIYGYVEHQVWYLIAILWITFFKKLESSCFIMLCSFLLQSKVNQLYVHTHPHFSDFLPVQGTTEQGVEFRVLCSELSLVIYFIHIPVSQSIPSPLAIHTFVLCVCVYFYFANEFIYTIFLDSTYMRFHIYVLLLITNVLLPQGLRFLEGSFVVLMNLPLMPKP